MGREACYDCEGCPGISDVLDVLACRVCNAVHTRLCACDHCRDVVCQAHRGEACTACRSGKWTIELNCLEDAISALLRLLGRSSGFVPLVDGWRPQPLLRSPATVATEIAKMAKYCSESNNADGIMQLPLSSAVPLDDVRAIATALATRGVTTAYDPTNKLLLVQCDEAVRTLARLSVPPADRGFFVTFLPFASLQAAS